MALLEPTTRSSPASGCDSPPISFPSSENPAAAGVSPPEVTDFARQLMATLNNIGADQAARGFVPPTADEVDRRIRESREGW